MMRSLLSALLMTTVFAVALAGYSAEATAGCPPGKVVNQDTAGNCCWPGQAWSGSACVGKPISCPEGFTYTADGTGCELLSCPDGLRRAADKVHCCWPGQGWSSAKGMCVGEPRCEGGYVVENGGCVAGPTIRDTDQDGFVDASDECVELPEDPDGFQDDDGCPDDDNDVDGIPDVDDACPMDAEDFDGFRDEDGCPEEDNDEDGYPDSEDQCPNRPEEMENRGVDGEDGCPDDDDVDGVSNSDDQCPGTAEDIDGFEDGDGCPEYDNDNDGVPDAQDRCPKQAEDYDFFQDGDGCPDNDDDYDGVADASDVCPHEMEDGEGMLPSDGCRIPAAEQFHAEFFPEGAMHGNIQFTLLNIPAKAGDMTYLLPLSATGFDDYHAWGLSLGIGWDSGRPAPTDEFSSDTSGTGIGVLLGGHYGLHILEWPMFERNGYTLLNPVVGFHVTLNGSFDRDPSFGSGFYFNNAIVLGDFITGLEYRGFQFFSAGEAREEGGLGFFIGWHTR